MEYYSILQAANESSSATLSKMSTEKQKLWQKQEYLLEHIGLLSGRLEDITPDI